MKLYQTRPIVAGALSSALSARLLESQVLLLHHAPYKSSLMTYLGQWHARLDSNQRITGSKPAAFITWLRAYKSGLGVLRFPV